MASGGAGSDAPTGQAIRNAVDFSKLSYPLQTGVHVNGEHCWSQLEDEGVSFELRGPTYLSSKKKVKADPAIFEMMHVDMFCSNDRIGNLAARKDSWLRKAREAGDKRYYMVVVYVTPALPYVHVILYLAANSDKIKSLPHLREMWEKFTSEGEEAEAFRNDRWKVIPRVAEGPWLIMKAVGTKPAMLAQKLTHHWILCDADGRTHFGSPKEAASIAAAISATKTERGSFRVASVQLPTGPGPYIESDCDVASSSMAYYLVSMLQSKAKNFAIDLGFALEPRTAAECPEVLLGCLRLSRIDITQPPLLSAQPEDIVLGTTTPYADKAAAEQAIAAVKAAPKKS